MASFISPINNRKVLISRSFINDQIRGKSKEQILELIKNFNEQGRIPLQSGLSGGQRQRALHDSRRNRAIAQGIKERIGLPIGGIGQATERAEIIAPSRIEDELTKLTESMKGEQVSTLESPFILGSLASVTAPPLQTSTNTTTIISSNLILRNDFLTGDWTIRVEPTFALFRERINFSFDVVDAAGNVVNRERASSVFLPTNLENTKKISLKVFGALQVRLRVKVFDPSGNLLNERTGALVTDRTVIPVVIPPVIPPVTPPPTGTGRQEGFVQIGNCKTNFVLTASQLIILGNRHPFVITNPSTEKGTNTIQEILAKIDSCGVTPPPIDLTPNIFDKGIVALLAVAALMPRGKKK